MTTDTTIQGDERYTDPDDYRVREDAERGSPVYEPCPWCASRGFGLPCPTHGAEYQAGALRLAIIGASGRCEVCDALEANHDRRYHLPGAPLLCLR